VSVRVSNLQQDCDFLRDDLYDALRWLFEGAVAWQAGHVKPKLLGRQQVGFAMFTSLIQARALYEFFYAKARSHDDLRSRDFAPSWTPPKSDLYKRYMASGKPAQKRVFHLVRDRSIHAGGVGPDRLNQQVLNFANELKKLTAEFAANAEQTFSDEIRFALTKALEEANKAAKHYDIPCPI
jgi:hypothetical protein